MELVSALPVLQGDRASGSVGITTMMESLPLDSVEGMAAGAGVAVGEGAAGADDDWEACGAAGAWVGAMPRASAAAVGCAAACGWDGAAAGASCWAAGCAAGGSVGLAVEPQATAPISTTIIPARTKLRNALLKLITFHLCAKRIED